MPPSTVSKGWINGFIGVLIFSGSLPATRLAVIDLNPYFVTVARASIAGLIALAVLLIGKQKKPNTTDLGKLALTAFGVVLGFPLFSALALQYITSANSIVFLGLLPLATASFGVWRHGEKPKPAFWLFSAVGATLVVGFAVLQGFSTSALGNGLMLLAIITCGLGYAEGASLAKTLGGWQVISWCLVISLPIMLPLTFYFLPNTATHISLAAWGGLLYVSVFSMFVGFIFWYKGMAQGGIASISQLQLLQPFFGLGIAAGVLHEHVSTLMIIITLGVIACVAGSKKFA
ncbi:transporter [Pelobium manganitolerans]|uniref:Transporter n=1 Tax=Pelobium manganitolerans TaxID=1842495 RepID=A0A419S5P2_9SPHI|nr:DMT family transporter [Pelobium manganitolerans]RKD16165.1 transporter [Pelobium manganitolerans]